MGKAATIILINVCSMPNTKKQGLLKALSVTYASFCFFAHKLHECFQIKNRIPEFRWIGPDIRAGYDEYDAFTLHFFQLLHRNSLLEGTEIFYVNPVCFCHHLPPAVFACCLSSQHDKFTGIIR